jgi:hypothetical protein
MKCSPEKFLWEQQSENGFRIFSKTQEHIVFSIDTEFCSSLYI